MIRLVTITKVLNEAAEKRLDEFESKLMIGDKEEEEDQWSKMGIPNPFKTEEEIPKGISFTEEDYESIESLALVKPSSIDLVLELESGSEVYIDSGKNFTVKESLDVIWELMKQSYSDEAKLINNL